MCLMSWHLERSENSEAIKQPIVYSDVTHFLMKQYSFKNAGRSINKNISTFCQVVDQLLQQNIERIFFISVQLRDIYRFLWKIVVLTVSLLAHLAKGHVTFCHHLSSVVRRRTS